MDRIIKKLAAMKEGDVFNSDIEVAISGNTPSCPYG